MKWLSFDRISGVYLWIAFVIVFGVMRPSTFLTSITLHAVGNEQAIAGIAAVAILIPLVAGHFDLSVGANANLCGIVAVVIQDKWHWSIVAVVIFSVMVGTAVGLVNGLVVVYLRVNSFIATLGMSSILGAALLIVTASLQPAPPSASSWATFSQQTIAGFQIVVLYMLIIGIVVWWFLDHTPAGRFMRATGSNAEAARLTGIRVNRWSVLSLTLAGVLAGFGGVLYTSQTGPSLTFGPGLLLPAFAAAFLGSTQFSPGRFNVFGTLLAIYVLATGVTGMELISGQQWLNSLFDGVALIAAVALAVNRQAARSSARVRRGRARVTDDAEIPHKARQWRRVMLGRRASP